MLIIEAYWPLQGLALDEDMIQDSKLEMHLCSASTASQKAGMGALDLGVVEALEWVVYALHQSRLNFAF